MRILLIDPPYGLEEIGGVRRNFKFALNKIPSLGLAYLAAVAEREGHKVKIVDCTLNFSAQKLKNIAQEFDPQVVGITATSPTFINAVNIGFLLRSVLPEAVFVAGGAHPTADPFSSLSSGAFEFLVLGEGEITFLELLHYIEKGEDTPPYHIAGIAFRENGRIVITSSRELISDLDSLPLPARHLLPALRCYQPTPASYRRLPLAIIITSRGCPKQCAFCDRSVFGNRYRRRSPSSVLSEVWEVVTKYQAKEIRFFDDNFTLDHSFVEEICREMKKFKPALPWTCLTSVSSVNLNLLKMMREAGCWQVLFGLESGDDRILAHLGKGNTVAQNRKAVLLAREAGLRVRADFLVGTPWETPESLKRTVEFAKSLPLDFAHFNKFVPYPGTDIYRELKTEGREFIFDKASFINNQCDFIYLPPAFSEEEFKRKLSQAYREFYFRPGYILRKLLGLRSFTEFVGHLKGFLSIFSL